MNGLSASEMAAKTDNVDAAKEPLALQLAFAEQVCLANHSSLTPNRKKVLSVLLSENKALSAYDIKNELSEIYGKIPLPMTIYRSLEFLVSIDLVHRLDTVNKFVICRHFGCQHQHQFPHFLICQKCGRVDEVSEQMPYVDSIAQTVANNGFKLATKQVELSCICSDCLES